MTRARTASPKDSSTSLGFEAKLWLAADEFSYNMDAAVPSEATSEPQATAYKHADPFHPDLRAHYALANPPFNDSDWHRQNDDVLYECLADSGSLK